MCTRGGGRCKLDFRFFSILYGTPATCSESQLLEAWPASIYGHLREGYLSVPSQSGRNVPTCLGLKRILYVIQRLGGLTSIADAFRGEGVVVGFICDSNADVLIEQVLTQLL